MFIKRFKLFNLLGFPIYLDVSWFVIAVLLSWSLAKTVFPRQLEGQAESTYWLMGIAGALGLFASVLAHELGHAVIARRFDLPMRGITLFIFGGVAEMSREPPGAKSEFFVAIAGPIVSVALSIACGIVVALGGQAFPDSVSGVLWYLAMINAVIVAFNMIPAFPLDGGRVLRSALWYWKGNLRWATRIASTIGSGFGLALILLGLLSLLTGNVLGAIWQFLIGMFLRNAAQMSYQQVLVRRALDGEPVSRFMNPNVITVPPSMTIDQLVDEFVYRHHYKMYPVTEDDRLLGCITTREIQQVPRERWAGTTVAELIQPCREHCTATPEADAMEAMTKMSRQNVSRMMIVRDGRLEGILSLKDLMAFIALKVELGDDQGPDGPANARPLWTDPARRYSLPPTGHREPPRNPETLNSH